MGEIWASDFATIAIITIIDIIESLLLYLQYAVHIIKDSVQYRKTSRIFNSTQFVRSFYISRQITHEVLPRNTE